jgi:hypothetical protein
MHSLGLVEDKRFKQPKSLIVYLFAYVCGINKKKTQLKRSLFAIRLFSITMNNIYEHFYGYFSNFIIPYRFNRHFCLNTKYFFKLYNNYFCVFIINIFPILYSMCFTSSFFSAEEKLIPPYTMCYTICAKYDLFLSANLNSLAVKCH